MLEDAKVYSEHAKKKEIDVSDVQLAIEAKMDHSFTPPPPREVSKHIMQIILNVIPSFSYCWRLLGRKIPHHYP